MVDMDIHKWSCVSWLFVFDISSIHIPEWKKMKIMEILTSIMNIMIERWIYTNLSWTIDIKSQVSIIKWWTSILNNGYPLYGISNHVHARLFAFGFPFIHISDWQIKIMDILLYFQVTATRWGELPISLAVRNGLPHLQSLLHVLSASCT